MAFTPVVRNRVCEDGARSVESRGSDGSGGGLECYMTQVVSDTETKENGKFERRTLEARASVFVPEVDCAVGSW